ncbi:hypothetical protein ACFLR4_01450 [Bacteroidota bacterium]
MKNNFLSAVIILLFLFTSCDNIREVDQDTMVSVYVNIVIAEETYRDNLDSLSIVSGKVYDSFGVTEEEYTFTFNQHKEDKEYWDEFFNKSTIYLDSLKSLSRD